VLRVRWPDRDGTVQEFRDVPANRRYRIRQGASAPEPMNP